MGEKRQITIGGVPGAGKSTCGRKLAEFLGYKFYSVGDFRRDMAQEKFNTDISTLNLLEDAKLFLKDYNIGEMSDSELLPKVRAMGLESKDLWNLRKITSIDTDVIADNMQKDLGIKGDHFIIEGRLAWKFCPGSFSIFFTCDPKVAADRILKDPRSSERQYSSVEEVEQANVKRMESDTNRYLQKYGRGYDCYNPKHFKFIIDTTNLTSEETLRRVIEAIDMYYGDYSNIELLYY